MKIAYINGLGDFTVQEVETAPSFDYIDITNVDLNAFENPTIKDGQIVNGEPIPVEVPEIITPIQFWRSVYRLTGITEAMVKEQINQLVPEPTRVEVLIMLEKATQFERNNPELIQMASLFNIDNETLDLIFINA